MPAENTQYFDNKKITVTDKFITAGKKSYTISTIKSVAIDEKPAGRGFGVVAVLLGVFIFACTVIIATFNNALLTVGDPNSSNSSAIIFSMAAPPLFCGVLSIGIGLLVLIVAKKHYSVRIDCIDETDSEVFTSGNLNEVENIGRAIEEAVQKSL